MTFKISYAKCPTFGTRATIKTNDHSFEEVINRILEEAVIFAKKRVEKPGLVGFDNPVEKWLRALKQLAWDLSKNHSEEFDKSKWSHLISYHDWCEHVMELWAAPFGEIPMIGQRGSFNIVLDEKYEVLVIYRPSAVASMVGHLSFNHVRDGIIVKEPMPLSETGYLSWHTNRDDILKAGSVKAHAEQVANHHATVEMDIHNQMALL